MFAHLVHFLNVLRLITFQINLLIQYRSRNIIYFAFHNIMKNERMNLSFWMKPRQLNGLKQLHSMKLHLIQFCNFNLKNI
jgi:hypothetical protein